MLRWEEGLDAVRDTRRRPQISTSVIVRAMAVMFLSRLGSLNALEQSRPSRFWPRWLGAPVPSADTIGRVCALVDAEDLRSLHHDLYSRLKRMKALPPPAHGLTIENQGFNELVNRGYANPVYKHQAHAMLNFWLMAVLCLNLFLAFYRRDLTPAARQAASMLQIARQIAAELFGAFPAGPARAPM